jgi:peptidoglycan/LPS O-acetylase OafA/YrhL
LSAHAHENQASSQPRHVPELDGVRGLAIALVMALHFVYPLEAQNFAERLASKASGYGLWGVDLFFVLSGFLITGILYDAKGSEGYFKNFYMRRTLRIFPLYYGVLLLLLVAIPRSVAAAIDPALLETRQAGSWLATYLTNIYIAQTGEFSIPYVSHFWSLAVEEHFYLFWPFLIGFLSRVQAMRACIAFTLFALCLRIGLVAAEASPLAPQVLTPCRLDTLCLGALLALAIRGPGGAAVWSARSRRFLPVTALAVIALSALHVLAPSLDVVVIELRGTVLALFFAVLILNAQSDAGFSPIKRLFRLRFLGTLGKYSYGLYVFHGLVAFAFEQRGLFEKLDGLTGSHGFATFAYVALGVGLSFLISVASYELFEVRFLALKKLFDYRTRRADKERARVPGLSAGIAAGAKAAPELASRSPE